MRSREYLTLAVLTAFLGLTGCKEKAAETVSAPPAAEKAVTATATETPDPEAGDPLLSSLKLVLNAPEGDFPLTPKEMKMIFDFNAVLRTELATLPGARPAKSQSFAKLRTGDYPELVAELRDNIRTFRHYAAKFPEAKRARIGKQADSLGAGLASYLRTLEGN